MSLRSARSLLLVAVIASCAAPEPRVSPPTEPPASSAPPGPTVALHPGAVRFVVVPSRSHATIRVREQVAGVAAPGDAQLTTQAFSGALVLLVTGAFAPDSRIAVELETLKSDSDLRDEWIKINTLQTNLYPRAEFTAARVADLPLPLPSEGEWTIRLDGTMKIHGVERDLVWELRTTRTAGEVRVRGATSFHFADYGMTVPANRLILSVVDDIKLEIDLVAREA